MWLLATANKTRKSLFAWAGLINACCLWLIINIFYLNLYCSICQAYL